MLQDSDNGALALDQAVRDLRARCAIFVPHPLPSAACSFALSVRELAMRVDPELLQVSTQDLKHATTSRKISFLAGRLCATEALRRLGVPGCHVLRGDRGEPLWPPGVVGSITHSAEFACAAVHMRTSDTFGLGIDSEQIVDADALSGVVSLCLTDNERVQVLDSSDASLGATIVFSLKESFFKAIFPVVRRFVDFAELEVSEIDVQRGLATLQPGLADWSSHRLPMGKFSLRQNHIHTSVLIA
jgi:enterobactin synthetase component D